MSKVITAFIVWFLFWICGWLGLRSLSFGQELLNQKLFLETDKYKTVFLVGLVILIATIFLLAVIKFIFGQNLLFVFKPDRLNYLLLGITFLILAGNILAVFMLGNKNQTSLLISLTAVTAYYFIDVLFQQIINFGFYQGELLRAGISSMMAILIISTLFALSHLLAMTEGAKMSEVLILVVIAFVLGLVSSILRQKYGSLIPGFLLHFSGYLLLNGPLLYLLTR